MTDKIDDYLTRLKSCIDNLDKSEIKTFIDLLNIALNNNK